MQTQINRIAQILLLLYGGLISLASPVYATDIVVNTTADTTIADGDCSLREALLKVMDGTEPPDCSGTTTRIEFDLPADSTITLNTALPILTQDVTISSDKPLTIRRSNTALPFRIFTIEGPPNLPPDPRIQVVLEGLTIANGYAKLPKTLAEYEAANNLHHTYGYGGGGILNKSSLTLKNCLIIENYAESVGGGINNHSDYTWQGHAILVLHDTTIAHNQAAYMGAGIHNDGSQLWMRNSTIFSNILKGEINGIRSAGAGINNRVLGSQMTIINSVISDNQIIGNSNSKLGGGIYANKHAHSMLINTTIVNNSVSSANIAGGAGIFQNNFATPPGSFKLYNSVVQANQTDGTVLGIPTGKKDDNIPDPILPLIEQHNNLIVDSVYQLTDLFKIISTDYAPHYQPLANSPIVNAGDNAHLSQIPPQLRGLNQDMAEMPRVSGNRVDMGAYEYQELPPASSPAFSLIVAAKSRGTVTVNSGSRSRTCGSACNYGYTAPSLITLTTQANAGYLFTGWNNPLCVEPFLLNTTTHCIATFTQTQVAYASTPPPNTAFNFINATGTPTTQILTIENQQTGTLTVELLGLNGPQAEAFALDAEDFPLTLTQSTTTELTIGCHANPTTPLTAHLDLQTNDPRRPTVTYPLKCTSATENPSSPPSLGSQALYSSQPLPASELQFIAAVGTPTTQALRIISLGDSDLVIEQATISGSDAAIFTVLEPALPLILGGFTAQQDLVVQCLPPDLGTYHAILQLTSNDSSQPSIEYPLHCDSQPAAPEQPQLTVYRLGSGSVHINEQWCQTTPCHYPLAAEVTALQLVATPALGWQFRYWDCAGLSPTSTTVMTVPVDDVVNNDRVCKAVFEMSQQLHLVVNSGQADITSTHPALPVACQDNCVYEVPDELNGQALTLTVTPRPGWLFTGWQGTCTNKSTAQLRWSNQCEVDFTQQTLSPFSAVTQGHLYQVFNYELGYAMKVAVDEQCLSKGTQLDYPTLWGEIRTNEIIFNRPNNICIATLVADSDQDSIPDEIEQVAPNRNDGNYDDTPDFQQSHVISGLHESLGSFSLELASHCQLSNVALHPYEVWGRLGTFDFTLSETCTETAFRMVLHSVDTDDPTELEEYLAQLRIELERLFHPGRLGGRFYYTEPYLRVLMQRGEIVLNDNGYPVIEVIGHLYTEPFPETNTVSIELDRDHHYRFEEEQETYDITLNLIGEITEPLTIYYGDISALENPITQNYTLSGDKLTWYPGQTKKQTIILFTQDDDIPEEYMALSLYFGNPSRPQVVFDDIIRVGIIDDDSLSSCSEIGFFDYINLTVNSQQRLEIACDFGNQTISASDLSSITEEDRFWLKNVVISSDEPSRWFLIPPSSVINQGIFKTNVYVHEGNILGTLQQYSVLYRHADLSGSQLAYIHFTNDTDSLNIIRNNGVITHAIIDANVELRGGTLNGVIINHGQLINVEFVGTTLSGGQVGGQITLHADSIMRDVTLNTLSNGIRTSILGGKLGGQIDGDFNLPAKLAHLTILPNTQLSNVLLSENVTFAGTTTLSGMVQGAPNYPPILLENIHIQADAHLSHVILGSDVTVENGVIFGNNVQIAADANIRCHSAIRLAADYASTPSQACFFNHFTLLPAAARDSTEQAHLYTTLLVAAQDLQQAADLVVVAIVQTPTGPIAYMRDGEAWLPWDGHLEHLTAFDTVSQLRRQYKLSLYRGTLNQFDGAFTLYAGYRLANGDIVYNGISPLAFTLSTPQMLELSTHRDAATLGTSELQRSFFTSFIRRPDPVANARQSTASVELTHIHQRLHIEPRHQRQTGEIIAVLASATGNLKMLDADKQWQNWTGELTDLTAVYRYVPLPETVQLHFTVSTADTAVLYVGYRIETDEDQQVIVFNGGYPVALSPSLQ